MNRIQRPYLLPALLLALLVALLLAAGCAQAPTESSEDESVPGATTQGKSFDTTQPCPFVVVSDSLAATQNSSMREAQSVNLFPALIAGQAGWPYEFARISAPGFPAALVIKSLDPLSIEQSTKDPGEWGTRTNPGAVICNVSVPGAKVGDALLGDPQSYHVQDYEPVFLGNQALVMKLSGAPSPGAAYPLSQVAYAEALRPETAILWLGSNDVLWSALMADASYITPEHTFRQNYREAISRIAATGADLVVANIPDVTVIPFLVTPEEFGTQLAESLGVNPSMAEALAAAVGVGPGDHTTLNVWEYLTLVPPSETCFDEATWTSACLLPPGLVFTAEELDATQEATRRFNRIIRFEAWRHHAAFVDIHAILNLVDRYGYWVGPGRVITTDMLGGVFTLDGIHPTNTGHAVIANAFITALNWRYGAGIPWVSVRDAYDDDPLVPENIFAMAAP